MNNFVLEIKNLTVSINEKNILKHFNLNINVNETHIIMGPNGCGKSTLAKIIAGYPEYKIKDGDIIFLKKNLKYLLPEERSHLGIFLAFQSPIEIFGVSNFDFLRLAYNEKQKILNKKEITPLEFLGIIKDYLKLLNISEDFLKRDLNQGFSGGEKKKNEMLQMLILQPKLIILDELDSGLDMDALQTIFSLFSQNLLKDSAFLIITHNPKIFDFVRPNFLHIMKNGQISKTGNLDLLKILEKDGYKAFI
jgi:Fe-S cluster assembly ATP-binding protein